GAARKVSKYNMNMHRRMVLVAFACLTAISGSAACSGGKAQDITKVLTVGDVKTGWYDAGVENGLNKLVPSVMLTLTNGGSEPISNVQLNAVIRRVGETEEWGGA